MCISIPQALRAWLSEDVENESVRRINLGKKVEQGSETHVILLVTAT